MNNKIKNGLIERFKITCNNSRDKEDVAYATYREAKNKEEGYRKGLEEAQCIVANMMDDNKIQLNNSDAIKTAKDYLKNTSMGVKEYCIIADLLNIFGIEYKEETK